jgi:maleamate amidohydrolase
MIDMVNAYTHEDSPLYAPGAVEALPHGQRLLERARKLAVPVIHTTIRYHAPDCRDGGIWVKKAPVMKAMVDGNPHAAFCEPVRPLDSELVVTKQYASAFFGTSLAATLTAEGIDTLVLAGFSTSGCIRASAVDGLQYGFRVIVAREAVGDRHPDPHEANLFDIDRKYGDVISVDEVLDALAAQAAG